MQVVYAGAVLWGAVWLAGCTCAPSTEEAPEQAARPKAKAKARPKAKAAEEAASDLAPPMAKPTPPDGPNVLVIVWDTVRADHLSVYGYPRATTPALEAFAKDAVVYERAVSPGMWTLPSHASLFTGLPVSAHGANADHKWLDGRFPTMAETFRAAGYDTYLFSANPYLGDHTNVGQGFEVREFPWSKQWKKKSMEATTSKILDRDASNVLGPAWKETTYKTGRTNDKFKDAGPVAAEALFTWVDGRTDAARPWLAVLNYMEAHAPRIPSLEARRALFDEAEIERQLTLDQSYGFLLAYTVGVFDYSDDDLSVITSTYDASLRDLDAATQLLFEQLARRGELEDTVVVVTADHGEHLGEHHKLDHKYSVYNPLVRVPLIIRYPKKLSPGRVAKVVSNLSVFATVSELAGVPLPEGTSSRSLTDLALHDGSAVSELVAGTPMALDRMEKVHGKIDREPFLRTYASVESEREKCIRVSTGTLELYAMPDDRLETRDLAPGDPERAQRACAYIDTWKATFEAYDQSKAQQGEGPGKLDAKTRQMLENLGYVEGDEE